MMGIGQMQLLLINSEKSSKRFESRAFYGKMDVPKYYKHHQVHNQISPVITNNHQVSPAVIQGSRIIAQAYN